MRTTITIDDQLLIELKTYAAQSGTSMTAIVEDALRAALARRSGAAPRHPVTLPTLAGSRLVAGVDLDDSADLLDRMEGTSR